MIVEFFSSPMGIAAILSFFIGSFGYVIARMWVQPLLKYRMLKSRVRTLLDETENLKNGTATEGFPRHKLRETASKLADCFRQTLPDWYQLMLSNRGESPDAAAADLLALANIKNRKHMPKRIAAVRRALRFPTVKKKG